MQDTSNSTSLQPQGSGGIQNGAGGLQQQSQNAATNQSSTTGQPQQDVLGPDGLSGSKELTVQGSGPVATQQVTSGKGSYDVFFVLLFGILVVLAYLAYKSYKKSVTIAPTELSEQTVAIQEQTNEITAVATTKQTKKQPKKRAQTVKPIKKSKAKSKTKAKAKKKK